MTAVPLSGFTKKRFEKFLSKCRENATSKKRFDRSFNVARGHIAFQATLKQEKRHSLRDEDIASVMIGGVLREDKSVEQGSRLEIAVEACILHFEWVQALPGKGVSTMVEPLDRSNLPEVSREVW